MNHRANAEFWARYDRLDTDIKRLADKNFKLLRSNPRHPSLQFKPVSSRLWSVRVGLDFRAVAVRRDDDVIWFWIGPHDEYNKLLK